MKRFFLLYISLIACFTISDAGIRVRFRKSLLGRDYVIAARVEDISKPVELGKMKVYTGLRVYNPQLVRFSHESDSIVMTTDNTKRGPQRVSMPVIASNDSVIEIDMENLFTPILRGVDILSGKLTPGPVIEDKTKVKMVKGDSRHLEVSVDYAYLTDSIPLDITIRKSLLLLDKNPMTGRPVDKRIGYKTTDSRHINRFDISNRDNITFYVSDEFPPLWQEAIRQGIEDWNIAFSRIGKPSMVKAIGYRDAGEGFDPFDLTNNCFNMVESDFANAMGCHWTDPRSGEIIQADVQFYSGVQERLKSWLLMQTGAYNKDVADGMIPDSVMQRMIRYAAAHEIGHCLGLEHNYWASAAYPTDSLRNASFCKSNGTTASIMDYARFNYVAQPGDNVTDVYPPLLGDYDIYAIEAGYRAFPSDADYFKFITDHQTSPRYLYKKAIVSTLPVDEAVQQSDLGDNQLKSSVYGISNIASLPENVLRQLNADDIYAFYFRLLMHTVPGIDRPEVLTFLENELNEGYRMLDSEKMRRVFGNRSIQIEEQRIDFIDRIRSRHELGIAADPSAPGMWMPYQMISDEVFSMLKADGMRMSKKDIYRINKRCAAGAALSLSVDNGVSSPFASASFVSKDGLVMTNFHCVSPYVQRLANGKNDYMKYGCWTKSRKEEAPLFNLQAHQLLSIEDVTEQVLAGTEGMDADERDNKANNQALELMKNGNERYGVSRKVYSMMGGQQYILARYLTFSDVRIVACPPMWLGAYGGDADNWKWPRYSCDFAFLRVYATPEGEPSDYSPINEPYHPESYLKIAKQSVNNGDLSLVVGYPAQTRKNIPAYALDKIVNNDTRLRVNALKSKIEWLRECSRGAADTKLSGYNVRIGKLMNLYLRSKGEMDGVRTSGLIDIKRREDLQLQDWINADPDRQLRYGSNLIAQMDSVYSLLTVFNHMDEAFSQFVGSGAGIIPFAGKFEKLVAIDRANRKSRIKDMENEIPEIQRNIREFFPSISMKEDCGMMKTLLPLYLKAVRKEYLPDGLKGNVDVDHLYATSILTDSVRLESFLSNSIEHGTELLATDSLYRICIDIYVNRVRKQNRDAAPLRRLNTKLYGVYMRAKSEMHAGKIIPYDANHTLRFSAGRVKDINHVADMVHRKDYVSARFNKLLKSSDPLPIACFSTNAETSAGNSGSPVLNAKGEFIGLNFDRTAGSAFSIYRSDPLKIRNISVSIDYILWVVKNMSPSGHILEELGIKQ